MELRTLAVMVFVAGFVWVGFAFFLVKALRSERRKKNEGTEK